MYIIEELFWYPFCGGWGGGGKTSKCIFGRLGYCVDLNLEK